MQQLVLDGWVRAHGQGQPPLRLVEAPRPVDELKTQRRESLEPPKRRPLRCGLPAGFMGSHLQVTVEVMSEDGREQKNLVAGEGSCRHVVELALGLQLRKHAFLSPAAVMEDNDVASPNRFVRDNHLKLIAVDLRDEEIQLDRFLVTNDDGAGADKEEPLAAAPGLGLPLALEVAEVLVESCPETTALDF